MKHLITLTRNCFYSALYMIDCLFHRQAQMIVLCYHGIASHGSKYDVSIDEFKKQMIYLKSKYKFISLADFQKYLNGKPLSIPSVLITFDDGIKSVLKVSSFIKKEGICPAIFVLSNPDKANRKEVGYSHDYLSKSDLKYLVDNGWTVGSHTATHPDLKSLTHDQVVEEVKDSKKVIEKLINKTVNTFAYPKGRYTEAVLETLKKSGYTHAFSMDDGVVKPGINSYTIPRIGVDITHNELMFKATISPSVVSFRKLIKKTPLINYL